ncbi:hypothetical protein ACFW6S_13420 [Streptomyces sp. NPDC058740]|uniref:hypothetical protein n=1 Tax=Streptomyces sp. NPDC058740 TaxID=3346619 RepID=UPI0036A7BD96
MTHTRSPLRALRAALFAAVCVTLAAVGHSSMSGMAGMSGHTIPLRSLLTAFAVTAALAWAAAGHRRGPLAIATGLAAVQGALHLIFGAGEHAREPGARGSMGWPGSMGWTGSMGSTGDPMESVESMASMGSTGSMGSMGSTGAMEGMGSAAHGMAMEHGTAVGSALDGLVGSGAGMFAAHLLAALACGLWLARGEAALFALARTVAATAFTPLRVALAVVRALAPVPPALRPVRTAPYPRALRGVVLAHAVSRRGPPRPALTRATALGARY